MKRMLVLALMGALTVSASARPGAQTQSSGAAIGTVLQESGVISGSVVSSSNRPLSGITVQLRDARGRLVGKPVVTSRDGDFIFPLVAYDTYTLECLEKDKVIGVSRVILRAAKESVGLICSSDTAAVVRRGWWWPFSRGPSPAKEEFAKIPVFYATDRERAATATLDYSNVRSATTELAMGRYDVSVPRDHRMGTVERPDIWTLYREDPARHFVIASRRQQSSQQFYDDIRRVVNESTRKDAFVFIHGFNVAFEDAVFRTAQIAYDLAFDGAPILYSWPSNTGESPLAYTEAQNNNDWTVPHLERFLRDVAGKTGASRIHLIAHSMGNRALVNALNRIPVSGTKPFNQILLTAPDMDAQTFVQLADAVSRTAERTTLYASASDKALMISRQLNAYPRAGDSGPGVVVVPGIDTVDVSDVDSDFIGHFYYGDNRSVVSDIFLLITQGLPPVNRPQLRSAGAPPKQFWRFAP